MVKKSKAPKVAVNFKVPQAESDRLDDLQGRIEAPTKVHVFRVAMRHLDDMVACIEDGGHIEYVNGEGDRHTVRQIQ